jgi:hypothetical protein
MDTPTTPRTATEDELAEQLRGLLAFVDRENRQSLEWMLDKPRKRLKLDRVLTWLDQRFFELHSFGQLNANKFCDLVGNSYGIVVPFKLSKVKECWWREPHVAFAQATEPWEPEIGNLVFLAHPAKLAAFFSWEDDWIDHSYLHLCRRS